MIGGIIQERKGRGVCAKQLDIPRHLVNKRTRSKEAVYKLSIIKAVYLHVKAVVHNIARNRIKQIAMRVVVLIIRDRN